MMFSINVHGDPASSESAHSALQFAQATLASGHKLHRVFFYHDGVRIADRNQVPPQQESNLQQQWVEFSETHNVELAVCIAAALKRGVLNEDERDRYERVAANAHPAFSIVGLGQQIEAAISCDRTITFPGLISGTLVKFLYLLRRTPYSGSLAAEAIDSLLVAGVFDQQVCVLFKDDGVLQLLKDQQGQLLGHRSVNRMLTALPEYEITDLFVCARSLERRNLNPDQLALPVQVVDEVEQQTLIASAAVVMND